MSTVNISVGHPNYTLSIQKPWAKITVTKQACSLTVNKRPFAISVKNNLPNISISHPSFVFNVSRHTHGIAISRGTQGPQGIPGPAGGSAVQYPAGENLSAGRVVVIDNGEAVYFQPSITAHGGRAFGVTMASANSGDLVNIQVLGEPTDVGFSAFANVPLYVGDDGEIQTTFPASGLIQKAGFGTGTNKIMIDFSTQILQ